MYKFIRLQLLEDNAEMIRKQTSDLKKFASLFDLQLHTVPYRDVKDTFLIDLPEDELDFCYLTNAVIAYCYFHRIAHRLASERVTVSFDVFLKNLALE